MDSTLWNAPLALKVWSQAGASEIYLDGERIYQFGKVGTTPAEEKGHWERHPKFISFSGDTDHLLAVRYSNFSAKGFRRLHDSLGFRLVLGDLNTAVKRGRSYVRKLTIFQIFFTAVPLAFAFLHLMLFAFHPGFRSHLYYALFTTGMAGLTFIMLQGEIFSSNIEQVIFLLRMRDVVAVFPFASGVLFAYSLFYPKLPKSFFLFLAAGIAVGIWGWRNTSGAIPTYFFLFALVTFAEILRVIVVALFKNKEGAWILGIGFLAFILPSSYMLLSAFGILGYAGTPLFPFLYGFLGLLISMSVYLARDFAKTNKNLETQSAELQHLNTELEHRVTQRTEALSTANSTLEARNEQIRVLNEKLTDENLRMGAELEVTERIQHLVLPTEEELKAVTELDIAGYMEAAHEVGGDYYDVLQQNGHLKIAIGDVTGHGLESGMVMLMTQSIIRGLLESGETDAARILAALNRAIYQNVQRMDSDKNLTLCLLDYADGEVKLSGQHEEMIIVRQNGNIELVDTIDLGFPIGLDDEIAEFIDQTKVSLATGDGVVLYTDGITEAENENREQYGLEQLCRVLSTHWSQSAEAIKDAVVGDVLSFIGDGEIYDDITLLVLKQK